ncbi:hypothetical protein RKLH11_4315 [Rhodobacteraceae bacterium KLH11]|nr:hypothetical protein RKLH11_4315 [Rhodobacteraceae bacterium KLH11]
MLSISRGATPLPKVNPKCGGHYKGNHKSNRCVIWTAWCRKICSPERACFQISIAKWRSVMLNTFRSSTAGLAIAASGLFATPAAAYPIDCAIFLCLVGGWPFSAECSEAREEFIRRITPYPVEPPLQLWRCPIGGSAGARDLTPMQRLNQIKRNSAVPYPEVPSKTLPTTVQASFLDQFRSPVVKISYTVDLSSSDFDVVRSIRVWHVHGYSYRVTEREGPCVETIRAELGTYNDRTEYQLTRTGADAIPSWMGMKRTCGSSFRGVGVEWTDTFGAHDYEVVRY